MVMWGRNLFFLGLVVGGAVALGVGLWPPKVAGRAVPVGAAVATPGAGLSAVVHGVDGAFRRQWSEEGLEPAPRAPELTVLRRLSLAMTGTVPSLEEIRRFEAMPAGRRVPAWLDGMLRDRRCADYLAERLARAFVGTEGGPFLLYRRRRFVTWLSDELMRNRPYDQVVREMIAAEGLWTDRPATNFVTVTYDPDTKAFDPERLAGRVARAFLGVRIDCAQCHDHPFQPWTRRDFQGIAAFFGQVHTSFKGTRDGDGEFRATDRKTGQARAIEPRVPFAPGLVPGDGSRRSRLARWVTDPRNPGLSRATANRVWALMLGRPLVEPVDDIPTAGDRPAALTLLADDFAAHGFDLRRLIRAIAATEVFQLDSAAVPEPSEAHDRAWAAFPLTRLRPEQVVGALFQAASPSTIDGDSHILVRLGRSFGQRDFVRRYGDTGEDEFDAGCGTIPQRLLMMNGRIVQDQTKADPLHAAGQIALLAPDDRRAVEVAYLTVLTRRPSPAEAAHFEARLAGTRGPDRARCLADLLWTLANSTEFSWDH
jgi:hypothetical protein